MLGNSELVSSISVRTECSGLMVLDADGAREPTARERAFAERDPEIQRAIKEADECREWWAAWDCGPDPRDDVFGRAALLVAPYLAERPPLDDLPLCPWCGNAPAHPGVAHASRLPAGAFAAVGPPPGRRVTGTGRDGVHVQQLEAGQ